MSLWAIIPVKPLLRGKSRLTQVLEKEKRASLNLRMLEKTLKVVEGIGEIQQKLVISRDPSALALARDYGARTVQEVGTPELNIAIRRATTVAKASGASGVLILPADLPLITQDDIECFIRHMGNPPEIIINPDRRKDGTNALLINPVGLIDYFYGNGSFTKHMKKAKEAGARIEICSYPSLDFDLDLPEDLDYLQNLLPQSNEYTDILAAANNIQLTSIDKEGR